MAALRNICCIPGCFENGRSHSTLHRFPNPKKYPDLLRTWLYAAGSVVDGLDNMFIHKNCRICRAHFEKKYKGPSNNLSNKAVPTINMPGLTTPQSPVLDRRPLLSTNSLSNITLKVKEPLIYKMNTSSCSFINQYGAKHNRNTTSGPTTTLQFPVLDPRPLPSTNNQNDITQKIKGPTTMPQFPVLDPRPLPSTNNQNHIRQEVKEPVITEMDTSSSSLVNQDGAKYNKSTTSDIPEKPDTRSVTKDTPNSMDDDLCNDQLNIPSSGLASPDTSSSPSMSPSSVEILPETTEKQNLILKNQNLKLKEQNLKMKEHNLKVKEQNLRRKEQSLKIKEDMLKLLYNLPNTDARGPPIHEDIATSWQDILTNGLPKDVKDSHMRSYPVPSNCEFLAAPDVNIEVTEVLQGTVVMTDSTIKCKQNQLGIALTALATAMELIMSNEISNEKLLQPISDACRLLCDNHYMETETRRNLVISAVNSEVRDVLGETERSKQLFGDDVEKLKAVKNILKSNTLKRVCRP